METYGFSGSGLEVLTMIFHNSVQLIKFIARKAVGHSAALRRNHDGALVLRTARGRESRSQGFVLRTSRVRKKRLQMLMAGFAALSLLIVMGLVAMDHAAAARSVTGASNAASSATQASVWNPDFMSDMLFMAGLPVFALLAAAQVLLLVQIRQSIKQ